MRGVLERRERTKNDDRLKAFNNSFNYYGISLKGAEAGLGGRNGAAR